MAYEMYSYLSSLTADYTTIFDATAEGQKPQVLLTETIYRKQIPHEYDSGALDVVTLSSVVYFKVQLQWDVITEAKAGLIFDLYASTSKANGIANTFYITLPDEKTYTVRFLSPVVRTVTPGLFSGGLRSIAPVTLNVEGKKP